MRSQCQACVKGNHEEYCSPEFPLDGFNPRAAKAVEWTRSELSLSDTAWLTELPYSLTMEQLTIVHASLAQPQRWCYVFDRLAAADHFAHQTTRVCFNAHTHVPVAFCRKGGRVQGGAFSKFSLEAGAEYLVNVGSVGQPRDGRSDASYVVFDEGAGTIELRRVDYPRPPSGGYGVGKPVPGGGVPPRKLHGREGRFDDNE